jgi:urea transport system permease protein
LPDLWLFALGGLFIFVTLFLPKGIVGTVQAGLAKRRDHAREAAEGMRRTTT